jgi:hypothetical protein
VLRSIPRPEALSGPNQSGRDPEINRRRAQRREHPDRQRRRPVVSEHYSRGHARRPHGRLKSRIITRPSEVGSSASMDAQDSRLTEGVTALTCRATERLPQKRRKEPGRVEERQTSMKKRWKVAAGVIILATLVFLPWSGVSTGCGLGGPGSSGGCVTEYMSPLGFRYPEWLGALFYVLLLLSVGWLLLLPFRRLDRHPPTTSRPVDLFAGGRSSGRGCSRRRRRP